MTVLVTRNDNFYILHLPAPNGAEGALCQDPGPIVAGFASPGPVLRSIVLGYAMPCVSCRRREQMFEAYLLQFTGKGLIETEIESDDLGEWKSDLDISDFRALGTKP